MKKVYFELFENWKDVQNNFTMNQEEPDEVLYAYYDHESWGCDGDAIVIYRNGSNYYHVSGGHCSCYGLEDQWEPEEYDSLDKLLAVLGQIGYGSAQAAKHFIENG